MTEQDGGAGSKEGTGYVGKGAELRVHFEQRTDQVKKVDIYRDLHGTAGLILRGSVIVCIVVVLVAGARPGL